MHEHAKATDQGRKTHLRWWQEGCQPWQRAHEASVPLPLATEDKHVFTFEALYQRRDS